MTAPLTFGSWLKRRRQGLGLTQKELARQVGYAPVTLRKVEADELRPSGQMARKLAEALELTPGEQSQFVRFARDEVHWDELVLPGRAPSAPMSTAQLPGQGRSAADVDQAPPALPAIVTQRPDDALDRRTFDQRRTRHNLPALTTALIGREEELAELAQLLADPGARLVTILSAGGMGKTSLALAAAWQQAEQFVDGVCWAPLAPLTEAKDLVLAIAAALGVKLQGERTPEQQVGDYLHAKRLLLVLDNFEHLLEGTPLVGELLADAPQLAILVTSRQRLNLSSETVIFLDGLRFPADEASDLLDYPAMQLFLLHARRVHPHYQPDSNDVVGMVKICRLVHGMPLGILLAAAWSRAIGAADIAAEIGRDLSFLQTDMQDIPVRQRNLRAVFLHTWNRLRSAERQVFMRLSVFRGGTTVEASRQVTGAAVDELAALIDHALLRRLPNGRFEIHELLRQFAAEQLTNHDAAYAGAQRAIQLQHSRYYLNLLSKQEEHLQGPQQRTALDIIRADFENLNVAWRWAVQHHEFVLLAPAVQALFLYCEARGSFREGVSLFDAAATELNAERNRGSGSGSAPQALWGQVSVRLGACEVILGNYTHGEQLLRGCMSEITQEDDRAFALLYLGQVIGERNDLALSRSLLYESLEISQRHNDITGIANALYRLDFGQSDFVEACRLGSESLALWRKLGRPDRIASLVNNLGWYKWCLGDYAYADACWREGIALCEFLELHNERAWALDCMGLGAWSQGNMTDAEKYIEEALAIYTELGRQMAIGMCMADLALVLVSSGQTQRAIATARRAATLMREIDCQMMLTVSLNCLGAALLAAGELEQARHTLSEAVQLAWQYDYAQMLMNAFYHFAALFAAESSTCEPAIARAQQVSAVTVLSFVQAQMATWQIFRDKAAELQARIGDSLPAAVFATATGIGKNRTNAEIVDLLLGETSVAMVDEPAVPVLQPKDDNTHSTRASHTLVEPLTGRELAVLHLLAAGRSNQDVAAELVITLGTAKWYVSQILGKLGVENRTQAVARGREAGLLI